MFLKIEAGLSVLALVLALTVPNLGSRWFEAIERSFGKLAKRRGLSVLVVGLTALALRAAFLPILPIPQPLIQDEFAYLLGADTFAHGRMTNPTPAMWRHFESLYILMRPTYNSKYPPAQSLFLAAGQVLMGHPFWGVWLSVGLMCAAITWMLQAWVGEGWALLGGFLAIVRIGAFSYWANSYWGGAVAALGGALALGALPRVKQGQRIRNAVLIGLGLAILANSRPYEGLVFSLPIGVALLAWMLSKERLPFSLSLRQVVLPLCVVLGLAAAWMAYYNWRVTGDPLKLPYQEYQAQYDPTPYFLWQSEKPLPKYRHPEMKEWEVNIDLRGFRSLQEGMGLAINETRKAILLWLFYVGPFFSVLLITAFVTLPYGFSWGSISQPTRFLILLLGVSLSGIGLEVFFYPQYAAPMTCLYFAILLLVARHLHEGRTRGKPQGVFLVRCLPVVTVVLFLLRVSVASLDMRGSAGETPWFAHSKTESTVGRKVLLSKLLQRTGLQLVLVRYSPGLYNLDLHKAGEWPPWGIWEWVYNSANIDSQKVIWAHDMGPAENEELIRYYKDRRVWLLYADDQPPKLVPYSEAEDAQAQASTRKGP
jgi:hypothetical protein